MSKTRSSSRLSDLSNQDLSDDSDTALIEHVKAIKRSRRGSKKKEKENGSLQLEENGTDDQVRTNGTHSPDPTSDLEDSKLNSSRSEEPPILVMEISQDANNDVGDDGEMIDLEIEEAEDNVDVDDESTADKIVITTSEDIISPDGETIELKVSEIPNTKSEEDESNEERDRDEREKTPGMTEEEVDQDFDQDERSGKSLNDTENGDDRWSVTVNIDSTDQKDLLDTQVAAEVPEKENEPTNNSFTHKISNLLGSWSPIRNQDDSTSRKDGEKVPVYYARISGRPGLKSGTPDRNIPGPSKEAATPNLTRFLDDSFRVRSEPAKVNRKEVTDQPNLKKYRGKRCLNTDEADETEEGFFSRLSFRKRRKLNDSEISTSSNFFGNLFRSPFKKRSVADVRPIESQSSEFKFSWLLTPFAFGKKKEAEESSPDVSTAEVAQEAQESMAPTTSDAEKTEIDKPVETKENAGCLIM